MRNMFMLPLSLRTPMGAPEICAVFGVREPNDGLDGRTLKPSQDRNPKPFGCQGSGLPCDY